MKQRKVITFGIILFAILGLLQAAFQPLLLDEAYYFYYSQALDFGYFDHPPLVAFLIRIGSFLGDTAFGVRFAHAVLAVGTFIGLILLAKPKAKPKEEKSGKFLLLMLSLPFIHALHIAIPDSGLIFFTVFFYFFLERYLSDNKWIDGLLLAVVSAGLIYAKYHGALTIFFALLSFPKLFRRKTFWVAFIVFMACLSPHLFWLYNHDFVTIQFQLFGRGESGFAIKNLLDYLLSFGFLVFGLFFVLLLIPRYFKQVFIQDKEVKNDPLVKVLKVSIAGFFVFFLIFAFRGPIEGNWLFSASVPALILMGRSELIREKGTVVLGYLSITLFMTFRVMLMTGVVPNIGYLFHFNGYEQWAKDVQQQADGKKVLFENSYQLAAMYTFQTGEESYSLNTLGNRSNQYDLNCFIPVDDSDELLVVSEWMSWENTSDTLNHSKGVLKMKELNGLTFLNGVFLELEGVSKQDDQFEINFMIEQRCPTNLIHLEESGKLNVFLELYRESASPSRIQLVNAEYKITQKAFSIDVIIHEDIQEIQVGLSVENGLISNNSEKILLPQ
ncbi:ArnT family glycosyltransferase [Parvicella tangerina]|uniref:Glycosyltransferase RgtA/B/C/D-like domain-containing protein n=1 Tax=Parvicella tangerina TaxID=2829795 RepID=A0A916JKT5_9FLAO|nr:glycosyltransferase family 39 protein [Parvicella tangerina]CAG5076424.1 hypothetical protein CRYO30217_00104 [Parvicella tangerina]